MPNKPEHASKRQRSLGPTGQGAEPPTVGPAPKSQVPPERGVIEQAQRDVEAGLKDTSTRGGPPNDLPGEKTDPQHTPGAQVPSQGLKRGDSGMRR